MTRARHVVDLHPGDQVVVTIRDRAGRTYWRAVLDAGAARLVPTSGNGTPPGPVIRSAARAAAALAATHHPTTSQETNR